MRISFKSESPKELKRSNHWILNLKGLLLTKSITLKLFIRLQSNQNFSTLGSIVEISPQGPILGFVFDDSIGNLLGFNESILSEA